MSFGKNTLLLNSQKEMPLLGLGVYKVTEQTELIQAINDAYSCGYRLIDTASFYKNEEGVGKAIHSLGCQREDIFVTTKIWNTAQRIGDIEESFNRSLERLGLDYIDLYMIHWPVPGCFPDTWNALEKIQNSGRIKSIGVSNFSVADLELLKTVSEITPAVNQIEFHPLFNHPDLLVYCRNHGISVQAYAPLARGAYLNSPLMIEIGKNHQKTPAQVGLRWLVQQGIAVVPKSVHKDRIEENSRIFDFELTEEEMQAITAMDVQQRVAGIPDDMISHIK